MLKYEIEPYWQLSAFLQQVVKGEMTNMWPLRITYVWTIPEVFLTNNTIMPWVFFSPKCYSLNVSVYQLPNYAIKIALRLPTAHKIGEKQTHTACNFLPMSPFDESLTAGKQVSLLDFFRHFERMTILLARWVSFYILQLWTPYNEGVLSIYKDTALWKFPLLSEAWSWSWMYSVTVYV